MKTINFSIVESKLTHKEYALPMVELISQFPVRDGKKTFEYAFRKQNPSKISIPVELLDQLQFNLDEDTGKMYLVLDGNIVERISENGFKRVVLCEKYRPAESTKNGAVE